ncbi:MAG: alpha/beta hydrolase [Spirochaetaceae bacterium]|jgi:acetyl esterase/lipase|nr:alpha/beta hydrolase [Spirochaetaceae bacterium]
MRTFTVDLWEGYQYRGDSGDGFRPSLDAYVLKSESPRPGALILPGSGYLQCSPREAEALAVRFNAEGFHAFVLWYSCEPRRHPVPILDCARALTLIRERGAEWSLNSEKIILMGFSAGGHLALSTLLFASRNFSASPGINPRCTGAQALVLCYPVITSGEFANQSSFKRLLGENPDPALLVLLSLENQITRDLPPVFLWHTYSDQSVPVENSFLLAGALRRKGVSLEMHIFPEGKHGMSLAAGETSAGDREFINPHVAQWFPLCVNWLKLRF